MKTEVFKTLHKSSFLLVLTFFTFFLSSFTGKGLEANTINNNEVIKKQITLKITKKTTLEELEHIKKQMKVEGLEFNYSNVVYNERKEIVAISISYKDANNNSGNYSVGSENPINDILIISNGNQISVKSEGSGNQTFINQGNGNEISEDHRKMMEERKAAMDKRRGEMDNRMNDRLQEMKESQSQMRARMEHKRDSIFGEKRIKSSQGFSGNYNVITKNTTNSELLELEKAYDAENVTFSYNQIERNTNDLITHISITVNNGKGSVSTSSFGNSKDPIKDVTLGVDQVHIIMKSTE